MDWDLHEDAIGLDRFKPWDRLKAKAREPSEDSSVATPLPLAVDELDLRHKKGPRPGPPAGPAGPAAPPADRTLRGLVREACVSLRRPVSEADKLVARLHREWLETPKQLLTLGSEGWARLALPVGLESELQKRLGLSQGAWLERERAPGDKDASKSAKQTPTAIKERPGSDLLLALRRHCGDAWASHLLSALGLQHRETVDANCLQSALRVLGVPSFSTAQVASAVRRAAKGAEARGPPSADAVVAAIHGPLRGPRAQEVSNIFFDLGGDIRGTLAVQALRRRLAARELPAVKAGHVSADEAFREFLRRWGSKKDVDHESFSSAHVVLSALYRGDEAGFGRLLRRVWRLPQAPEQEVEPAKPSRPQPSRQFQVPEDPLPKYQPSLRRRVPDRMAAITESIRCSEGASALLDRIRGALRSRGPGAVQLLCQRFQVAEQGQRAIRAKELRQGLSQVGVGASEEDVVELLRSMDVDGHGTVDLDDWLRVLRGPLSPARAGVVREAFASLCDREGLVDLRTLRARFNASKHPDVQAGLRSQKEVTMELMSELGSHGGPRISLGDFARHYETISAGIQDDQYFGHIVRGVWGLPQSAANDMAANAHRCYEGHIITTEGGLCGPYAPGVC